MIELKETLADGTKVVHFSAKDAETIRFLLGPTTTHTDKAMYAAAVEDCVFDPPCTENDAIDCLDGLFGALGGPK